MHPIANSSEASWIDRLWIMSIGEYAHDKAFVWASSCDDAIEEFANYLEDTKSSDFYPDGDPRLDELINEHIEGTKTRDELDRMLSSDGAEQNLAYEIIDEALADLSRVDRGYICCSWGVSELYQDSPEYREVKIASMIEQLPEIAEVVAELQSDLDWITKYGDRNDGLSYPWICDGRVMMRFQFVESGNWFVWSPTYIESDRGGPYLDEGYWSAIWVDLSSINVVRIAGQFLREITWAIEGMKS